MISLNNPPAPQVGNVSLAQIRNRIAEVEDYIEAVTTSDASFGTVTTSGSVSVGYELILEPTLLSNAAGAGVISLRSSLTALTTTDVGTLTLADGTPGHVMIIIHEVDGGSAVLTPATKTGFSTITFTAVGDSATLVFLATRGWMITSLNGAVAA